MNCSTTFSHVKRTSGYMEKRENLQSFRGINAMKAKDRIIGYAFRNAGEVKVLVCIIGEPKTPRCCRIEKSSFPHLGQWNDLSHSKTFKERFFKVFLRFARR